METPGMMLKREREARGLTLKYISSETKISESSLIAIENNAFESFPAEVFVKGFLRNYARALSLPTEEVIQAYMSLKGQTATQEPVSEIHQEASILTPVVAANTNEEDSVGMHYKFACLAVILILIACIGVSVTFTGTGEAVESNGIHNGIDQDTEDTEYIQSNTSAGWIVPE